MAEQLLTKDEVNSVIEFSQALAYGDNYGFWSPFLSNQFLQNLNNDAKQPTATKIRKALADYRNSAEDIQSYMEFTKFWDAIFSRTVQSYINALSFDLQVICSNAYTAEDYQSEDYINDKKRVNDFLNKFNYKNEFRKIVQQLMLHEVYFTSFRKVKWKNKGMKYAIQILPQDRCILDGYWEKGLLFSMDMSYFLQAGTDLNTYDPSMVKAYQRVFGTNEIGEYQYKPSSQFKDRDGIYNMYTQLSPQDGYWAFKFDTSNFNTTPFLAPILKTALTNDEVEQLQYNKDIAEAYAILAGEIATFDNAKSGTQADQMVFKPSTLGGFMAKAKQGLSSTIKLTALPVENIKWYQYEDKNATMLDEQLKTSAGESSNISRVIYSSDRMSNAEIEAALNEVYQTVRPLYYQFSNFLEFYVNQMTKKYKFRFIFDGATYSFERERRFDQLMKLADKGIVLNSSAFASAVGIEPQLFESSLMESKNSDWQNQLSLLLNVNTTAQNTTGRPKTDDPDDSTDRNYDM